MQIQPYLFLNGRCQEAIEFYGSTIGTELLMRMQFKDAPTPDTAPAGVDGEKIMHACLRVGDSQIFLSDGMARGAPAFEGFALSLALSDGAEAGRVFTALADGGTVTMPLGPTFFASSFGMVKDRFGVSWMILVQA